MMDKMISFLSSIGITNVEDFDIDFEMVGRNRFNRAQIDMVVVKDTPWEYERLHQLQEAINTVQYPYFLRFTYKQKPDAENVINLFKDWYQSIYRIPTKLNLKLNEDDQNTIDVIFSSEEEKAKNATILGDFRDFLVFICYEFLINEVVVDEGPTVSKKEMKKMTKVASEMATTEIIESFGEREIVDRKDLEKIIKEEEREMAEAVEDTFLKIMKANAEQLAKDRERQRLNRRGNYVFYENIGSIDRKSDHVDFVGKMYSCEVNEFGNKSLKLGLYDDNGDAIIATIPFNQTITKQFVDSLYTGINLRVRGAVYYSDFDKGMICRAHFIDPLPPEEIVAEEYEKNRVELHLHSNMSQQDGVTNMIDYAKYAKALGHKAIAVTDHAVVQGYPSAQEAEKKTGVKMIYGCEFYMVDKLEYVKNPCKTPLKKATYCVLDLETTGLSCVYNRIIEFGAVRVEHGIVTDSLDILINPEVLIPAKITDITGITNQMVKNQPKFREVMDKILDFMGDSILVTHNANFDFSFLQESFRREGHPLLTNPVIDTLALSRYLFPEAKRHSLGSVCRNLEINYDEESAHRADYDASVLNDCWQPMIVRLTKNNPNMTHEELGNMETPLETLKHIRPTHIIALCKNKDGLKDLFKLVTYSHVDYLAGVPKIPRRIVNEHRENLFIGSACFNGEIFDTARYYNDERLKEKMAFYDYIEIQPIANYSHLVNMGDCEADDIPMLLKNIVKCADEVGKMVCATGDVHYVTPKEKIFRDVMISAPGLEGVLHPLNPRSRAKLPYFENPDQHYRSTKEMLDCMSFLGEEKAFEITVTNTNIIADQIESFRPVPNDKLYAPDIPNSDTNLREFCFKHAHELYGDPLPEYIEERLKAELSGIIDNGYSNTYWIAHLLIKKANEDGYVVGSRGSVGSSFAATMANITEVNPLPPHYRCPKCKHTEWTSEEYPSITSGIDLPEKVCPICGEPMVHDGQNIPFQTFLGFHAEKTPDIDLNFPGDYQATAHNYCKVLLGEKNCFRAGTISSVEAKTAFGFARGYLERKGLNPDDFPKAKISYIASGCIGIKRTTGQHPGGIVVVPDKNEVFDFTPVQYPADDKEASWLTTHFAFESIHDTLLKLDMLGHVDPMALKMMCDLTNIEIKKIPLNDPKVLSIFSSPEALNIKDDYAKSRTGALGIPEFGTEFVRGMLEETSPKTFSDLVIISGLSHGTDVWNGNAQKIIAEGHATLREVIGCRDDIMTYLINKQLPPNVAFKIMEDVRKGRGLKDEYIDLMRANKVPEFYIDSCKKIKYLFPKGHAVAYVTMAIRVGYFKVYYPLEFYATFFSVRSKQYDIEPMLKGREAIIARIDELRAKSSKSSKEKISNKEIEQLKTLYIALEMVQRGFSFANIDLYLSEATNFVVDHERKCLIPPFATLDQLGESAADSIIQARKEGKFFTKEDLLRRTKLSKTNLDDLDKMGVLNDLEDNDQLSLFDFA